MSESNFIKSVKFNEDFSPFKGGDKIHFGGKKEVQNLIEFYLKSKPENKNKSKEEIRRNAERFKVNCVLGNNGGGKTSLLKSIYYNKTVFNGNEDIKYNNIFIDTFANLDTFIEKSVNNNVLKKNDRSEFFCEFFIFLLKEKNKKLFSSFLNLKEDYSFLLKYNFNKDWYNNFKGEYIYFSEAENKENIKGFINSELNFEDVYNFFKILYDFLNGEKNIFEKDFLEKVCFNVADLFIYLINESRNKLMQFTTVSENSFFVKQRGYNEFKNSLIFFKYFLNLIKKYKLQDNYFKNLFSLENNDVGSLYLKKGEYFNEEDFNILIKNTEKIIEILNLLEKLEEKKAEEKVKKYFGISLNYFLKKCSGYEQIHIDSSNFFVLEILTSFKLKQKEIEESFGQKFKLFIYSGIRNIFREKEIIKKEKYFKCKISKKEKNFLSFFIFNLDLNFLDGIIKKSFESLSAGEKMILTRFTNLYMKITEEFDKYKKELQKENKKIKDNSFKITILIDEPDLHLHLDWQKKYIQKLIDVFSTLEPKIKLHFIIATHSPFIISDLPAESIILLDKKEGEDYTIIKTYNGTNVNEEKYNKLYEKNKKEKNKKEKNKINILEEIFKDEKQNNKNNKTFGANFIDLINDGFFFENEVLMGSFAEENIKKLSSIYKTKILLDDYNINSNNFEENKGLINILLKKSKIIDNDINNFEEYEYKIKIFDNLDDIKNNIGDKFLKENLLYL